MENIKIKLAKNNGSTLTGGDNRKSLPMPPVITRGVAFILEAELDGVNGEDAGSRVWSAVAAQDFKAKTPVLLRSSSYVVDGNTLFFTFEGVDTVPLAAALGDRPKLPIGIEITGIPAGKSEPDTVYQFSAIIHNRRDIGGSPPEPVQPDFYRKTQVDALVKTALATANNALKASAEALALVNGSLASRSAPIAQDEVQNGVWAKSFSDLDIDRECMVQLINPDGLICTEDPLIIVRWTAVGLEVDFGQIEIMDGWKAVLS